MKRYTKQEARQILRQAIAQSGSQVRFAQAHGISPQYLNDMVKRNRDISGKILVALGLKKVVEFEPLQ